MLRVGASWKMCLGFSPMRTIPGCRRACGFLIEDLRAEWRSLDERIAAFDAEFVRMARADEAARRLSTIPGIGVINATALTAAVGDAASFGRGRDLAAWLGLTPRQATTGGKPRLLGISKRGNRYLRANLIHGARAALPRIMAQDTSLGRWLVACRNGRTRHRRRRAGGQACAHHLGGAAQRSWLRSGDRGGIERNSRRPLCRSSR